MKKSSRSFNEDWEMIHNVLEWGKYPTEHVIRFIARNYYKLERNKIKILDFGCDAGAHTWYLAREGFDTYAFDGSKSAIMKIKKRLEAEKLEAHLKVADALETGYEDDFFDVVVDNVCVYGNLIKNINLMYSDIYRILKPQGKLMTTCFGKKTDGYGSGEELEKDTYINVTQGVLAGRGTTHFFEKKELETILLNKGFKNINIDTILYTDNQSQIEQYIVTAIK